MYQRRNLLDFRDWRYTGGDGGFSGTFSGTLRVKQWLHKVNYVPELDVRVSLTNKPFYPNWMDIPSIVFTLTSPNGITKLIEGSVRIWNPHDVADGQKEYLPNMTFLEGKAEEFRPASRIGVQGFVSVQRVSTRLSKEISPGH